MAVSHDEKKIDELLRRGVEEVIVLDELRQRLLSGEKLRIKLGIDPTSPNLHIGRAVPLLKLRDFQELGHQIVFIVGDFTGVIGDTSDKDAERPMLANEVIEENKKLYFAQVGKLIDIEKAEMRYNSEWLSPLTYREIGEHADQFSVADFIARDNIKRRLDDGKRVSLREMLYPLMQGYDSVAVKADVEIGGTDQRFNLLAGRPLQTHFGMLPQHIMMSPLIPGTDGRKMSSSWGNTINLTAEPADMYGKVMSIHDDLIGMYFEVCTRVPMEEVARIQAGVADGTLHPKETKMTLAREIVTLYHDAEAATAAEEEFVGTFSEGNLPENIPQSAVIAGTLLVDALVSAQVATSKSDARRLIEGGAVSDHKSSAVFTDVVATLQEPVTLKIGKRRFLEIRIQE